MLTDIVTLKVHNFARHGAKIIIYCGEEVKYFVKRTYWSNISKPFLSFVNITYIKVFQVIQGNCIFRKYTSF